MKYHCIDHWKTHAEEHGYNVTSPDDIDILLEELYQTHRTGEIASIFGVSTNAIRAHLRSLGVRMKPDGNQFLFDAETVKVFYDLYQEGWSCERIGEKYKASWKCIYDSLKRHRYSLRPQGGFRHRNGSWKNNKKYFIKSK